MSGWIETWDAEGRRLRIAGQEMVLVPEVSIGDVEPGVRVTAIGYQEAQGPRIVTHLRGT